MSTDKAVTEDLMETLQDGKEGFEKGAEKLDESKAPQLAVTFRRLSQQRDGFYTELKAMAKDYGDKVEESGSVAAKLHRGWMGLKDALSGSDPDGVLDAAEQGEEHATKKYQEALADDISEGLRTEIKRQLVDITSAHQEIKSLRDNFKRQSGD